MHFQYFSKSKNATIDLPIDDGLASMIEKYVERRDRTNNDNLVIIGGDTGTGKSNLCALVCAYYSHLTGIPYDIDDVYFEPDTLIKRATSTSNKIFHFDEAVFGGMANDWQTKQQKKLIKMFMVVRKKKHFFVMCIPEPLKLKDYLVCERSIGMIRTYLRNGISVGRFVYYKKKAKDILYFVWKKTGVKNYHKYYALRGNFTAALPKVLDEDAYEAKKDAAILALGDDDKPERNIYLERLITLRGKISNMYKDLGVFQKDVAKVFGVSPDTLLKWRNGVADDEVSLKESPKSASNGTDYSNFKSLGKSKSSASKGVALLQIDAEEMVQ